MSSSRAYSRNLGYRSMRAVLRALDSVDFDDFDAGRPGDLHDFDVAVSAGIGPSDSEGLEWFYFSVCSPGRIAAELETAGARWGRATLIMPEYSSKLVRERVMTLCASVESETWDALAEKLARYLAWEFE